MAQTQQPWNSAWVQGLENVTNLLQEAKRNNTVRALYLHGQAGCGKSTTLLKYIMEQAKAGLAPSRVIKILPDIKEAYHLMSWFGNLPMTEDEFGTDLELQKTLTLTSHNLFTDFLFIGHSTCDVGHDVTLLIDVSLKPGVEEEIFFSYLIKYIEGVLQQLQTGENVHVAIILGGSFFSQRTFDLLQKLIPIAQVAINRMTPNLRGIKLDQDWKEDRKEQILTAIDSGGLVALSMECEEIPSYLLPLVIDFEWMTENSDTHDVKVVQIDPSCKFTTPIQTKHRSLAVFISSGRRKSIVMDEGTGQLVTVSRLFTRSEQKNDMTWVYKSISDPKDVSFVGCYTKAELDRRPLGDESLGDAWNKDIMLLGLSIVHKWSGVHMRKIPYRDPMNHYALADAFRRLVVLQCIVRNSPTDGYTLTKRGEGIRALLEEGYSWEVASLLDTARSERTLEDATRRVLVVMAHIMDHCASEGNFLTKIGHTMNNGKDVDVSSECAPVIGTRAHYGYIWLAAGVWLNYNAKGAFRLVSASYEDPNSWMRLSIEGGFLTAGKIDAEFKRLGLPELPNDHWISHPLSSEQLDHIDNALMWAYLHKTVYFTRHGSTSPTDEFTSAKECVSMQDVRVRQRSEFMNLDYWKELAKSTTVGGGFYASYTRLEMSEEPFSKYKVFGLTYLPPQVFDDAESKSGIEWPELVFRTGR